jgi:hypothetical protein
MKYIQLVFCGFILIHGLAAQNTSNSPLSRYGIGDLNSSSTGWMTGMSNAGVAYISDQYYNPLNPASIAFLRQTDVQLGLFAKYSSKEDQAGNTSRDWSGSLNHVFLAIPLKNSINELLDRQKKDHLFAIQFGLSPFSSLGYKSELRDSSNPDLITYRFLLGDGLINNFHLGLSYKYKDFAAGIQMNYLFGNLNYYQNLLFNATSASYDSYLTDQYHISGWQPVLGFIYRKILNEKLIDKDVTQRKSVLSVGLSLDMPVHFTSNYSAIHLTRFDESIQLADTVFYVNDQESKGELPLGIKAGIYFSKKEKLGLMTSLHYKAWDNAKLAGNKSDVLKSTTSIQLGGWYKPGIGSYDKFFKKSVYRFGAYYGNDYRSINGEQARDLGVTFGWGFPIVFLRQEAMIHLNFDLGQRKLEGQLTDNYFMIHFGIGINDNEWFLKRRYN